MSKKAIIICTILITFSTTAMGYMYYNSAKEQPSCYIKKSKTKHSTHKVKREKIDPVFVVSPRFSNLITLEKLKSAETIADLVPVGTTDGLSAFTDVKISILQKGGDLFAIGQDDVLTKSQKNLLSNSDYTTNFSIEAYCLKENKHSGVLEKQCFVYYISVIPEIQADYKLGVMKLKSYINKKSKEESNNLMKDKLKPGKLHFTINSIGEIENVRLKESSGYSLFDHKMVEIMKNLPHGWKPAKNLNSESVTQELVLGFGIVGC